MKTLILILLCLTANLQAQIKIDKAGDYWDRDVELALNRVYEIDTVAYNFIYENVKRVSMWNGDHSTSEGVRGEKGTIIIAAKDFQLCSINNIACVLVHESYHLMIFRKLGRHTQPCSEEVSAYKFELDFILKIPDAEAFLYKNALTQIKYYTGQISKGCR
jgi:hypothetical protein